MLTPATILIFLVGGVVSTDWECRKKETNVCGSPMEILPEFPQTKEAMDSACRSGIRFLRCIDDGFQKCNDNDEEEIRYMTGLTFYVETEICNEDSDIYQAISNNLRCIEETSRVTRKVCRSENFDENSDAMKNFLGAVPVDGDDEPEVSEMCLHAMFKTACISTILAESCGEPVGEAFVDVGTHVDPYLVGCSSEILKRLPYAVQAMKSIVEAEREVENAINKRKK